MIQINPNRFGLEPMGAPMAKTTTGSATKGVLTIALSIGPRPSKQKLTLNIESKLSADHHIVGRKQN